jgi:hypothetical protein
VPAGGGALVKATPEAGVTLEAGVELGPVPALFVAVTAHEYVVPFESPVTVSGLAAPLAEKAPGLQVAVKPVIGELPLGPGTNAMVAWPLPGVFEVTVGEPGRPEAMVMLKFWVAVPALLVAVMVPVYAAAVVGVPFSTPVVPFSDNPVGSAPAVTLNVGAGVPVAVNVKL